MVKKSSTNYVYDYDGVYRTRCPCYSETEMNKQFCFVNTKLLNCRYIIKLLLLVLKKPSKS